MLNYVEFILMLLVILAGLIVIILATGFIYNKKGYVSIITKHGKFFTIERRRYAYYPPFIYRKVAYYPIEGGKIRIKKKVITYKVVDIMKLYNSHVRLKEIFKDEKNLEANLERLFGIKILGIDWLFALSHPFGEFMHKIIWVNWFNFTILGNRNTTGFFTNYYSDRVRDFTNTNRRPMPWTIFTC